MDNQAKKEVIRKKLLDRRGRISEQEYFHKSDKIIRKLKELPAVDEAKIIHCYISINGRREVRTQALIKDLLASGHEVVVPVTHMETGLLTHHVLTDLDGLKQNEWGVPEPRGGREISEDAIDLVIVPMVGGDLNRNRIGYGKGFYDRFLQKVSCPKIGLLFESCLVDEIPVEPFDVRLDLLVTEERVIR